VNPVLELLTIDELLEFDIAQRQELLDSYIERREVAAAKICSAEDDALLDARVEEALRRSDRFLQAMRAVASPMEITQEIATRAGELRRRGVRAPVAQAEKEMAEQLGHASGPALNRWLRRHR
jgi:hypothetical protein